MSQEELIIIGGNEHARVIIDAALQQGKYTICGFIDPQLCQETVTLTGIKRLGSESDIETILRTYSKASFILGIGGDAQTRQKIIHFYSQLSVTWATVTHPQATVSPSAKLEEGVAILAKSIIQTGATIAPHCIINSGAIIEHDCKIGNLSHIAPGVILGGACTIGQQCLIGLGSRVRDHINIGDNVTVGSGSVVVSAIPANDTVAGVPARKITFTNKTQLHIDELCIPQEASLYEAMGVLAKTGKNVVFVIDKNKQLLGLLTNGDVRNTLLSRNEIELPVSRVMNTDYAYIGKDVARYAALLQMEARNKAVLPIVDNGTILGAHFISDFIGSLNLPNVAVIMAGGKQTHLDNLDLKIPKPMVRIAGRPILEHIILHLVSNGIKKIYLAINHLSDMIEDYFGAGDTYGCNIEYLRETKPLGSAGALSLLQKENIQDPFIMLNGDLVAQFNVEAMLRDHQSDHSSMTVGVHQHTLQIPFGVLKLGQGYVKSIEKKPREQYIINGGVYVIQPDLLKHIPQNQEFCATELINFCLSHSMNVGYHLLENDWIDIGHNKQLSLDTL